VSPEAALSAKLITPQQFTDIKMNYSSDQWPGVVQETIGHNIQQQAVGAEIVQQARQTFPTTIAAALSLMKPKPPAGVSSPGKGGSPKAVGGKGAFAPGAGGLLNFGGIDFTMPLVVTAGVLLVYLFWPSGKEEKAK